MVGGYKLFMTFIAEKSRKYVFFFGMAQRMINLFRDITVVVFELHVVHARLQV
jgi:hypothetical protein